MHALAIVSGGQQTHNYWMNIGPPFTDLVARMFYAGIASIEEQHTTQYGSIIDPNPTWSEQRLMHELMEIYDHYGCVRQATNPRIKALREGFLRRAAVRRDAAQGGRR